MIMQVQSPSEPLYYTMSEITKKQFVAVVIIEDNHLMRRGWRMVVEDSDELVLLADYENGELALSGEELSHADVVLLDIGLPGMSGIEAIPQILKRNPKAAIVMCTVHDDNEHIFQAICAGAVGYLLKKTPPPELIKALLEAAHGGSPMTPNIARQVIASFQRGTQASAESSQLEALTPREQEVLESLSTGKSYNGIAREMEISINSVRFHIRGIYEKLQVHSRTEAVAVGLKNKLIQPPR